MDSSNFFRILCTILRLIPTFEAIFVLKLSCECWAVQHGVFKGLEKLIESWSCFPFTLYSIGYRLLYSRQNRKQMKSVHEIDNFKWFTIHPLEPIYIYIYICVCVCVCVYIFGEYFLNCMYMLYEIKRMKYIDISCLRAHTHKFTHIHWHIDILRQGIFI